MSQVFLYLSNIPNQWFFEAKGISEFDNVESVYIAKIFAYVVGWVFAILLLLSLINLCLRILAAIPLLIGEFFDTNKFKAPLPFIEIIISVVKYPADIICFPFVFVVALEFYLLAFVCAGYSALSFWNVLLLLGAIVVLIGLLYYYYNRGKLVLLLCLNFFVFLIPQLILFCEYVAYPLLAVAPSCIIIYLVANLFRLPYFWKLIDIDNNLSFRYLSAYSFYVIVLILPLVWESYHLWCFVDGVINFDYDEFLLTNAQFIPSVFNSDLGTYMFFIKVYTLLCKIAAILTVVALVCFSVWYVRYITNGINSIGSRKDKVLQRRWDILYLRSFSKENANFIKLLTDNQKNTIIVNNPSVNNDFLMRGIYLRNDNWKHYVTQYIKICRHIIIQIGDTEGVKWEIYETMRRKHVHYYIDNRVDLKKIIANSEYNIDVYKQIFKLVSRMHYKSIIFSVDSSNNLLYYSTNGEIQKYIKYITQTSSSTAQIYFAHHVVSF